MHRKLLISLVLAVPFALVCNAEETSTVAPANEATAEITVKGAHPWKTKENTKVATELAHWGWSTLSRQMWGSVLSICTIGIALPESKGMLMPCYTDKCTKWMHT